jgi:dGTP triphosphohydrolase
MGRLPVTMDDPQRLKPLGYWALSGMPKLSKHKAAMLKELTWKSVIEAQELASQQHGQRGFIRTLFEVFNDAATSNAFFLCSTESA